MKSVFVQADIKEPLNNISAMESGHQGAYLDANVVNVLNSVRSSIPRFYVRGFQLVFFWRTEDPAHYKVDVA